MFQKVLSILAIISGIVGGAGLVLLSIFDTRRYGNKHNIFLLIFMWAAGTVIRGEFLSWLSYESIGFILNAIFVSIENQRLMIHHRRNMLIQAAFWSKLSFVLLGIALAIGMSIRSVAMSCKLLIAALAFGLTSRQDKYDAAAIIEWILGVVYFFYILSFVLDFLPAFRKPMHRSYSRDEKSGGIGNDRHDMAERGYANGANGHVDSQANEYMFTHRSWLNVSKSSGIANLLSGVSGIFKAFDTMIPLNLNLRGCIFRFCFVLQFTTRAEIPFYGSCFIFVYLFFNILVVGIVINK